LKIAWLPQGQPAVHARWVGERNPAMREVADLLGNMVARSSGTPDPQLVLKRILRDDPLNGR
jgi:hypothetical protein